MQSQVRQPTYDNTNLSSLDWAQWLFLMILIFKENTIALSLENHWNKLFYLHVNM